MTNSTDLYELGNELLYFSDLEAAWGGGYTRKLNWAGWASERKHMGRVARPIIEPRCRGGAREMRPTTEAHLLRKGLLLGRVRVCRCLCGVAIVASLDPACLYLFSFPLSPSSVDL